MQTVSKDEYNVVNLQKITLKYEDFKDQIKNIIIYENDENKIQYVKLVSTDKVLLLDIEWDLCYDAFFQIPTIKILTENQLDMKGYVKFKRIIGHKIIGILHVCSIDMPLFNENSESEVNTVYKIILSNNSHSYILLRSESNGYYQAYLNAVLYLKNTT